MLILFDILGVIELESSRREVLELSLPLEFDPVLFSASARSRGRFFLYSTLDCGMLFLEKLPLATASLLLLTSACKVRGVGVSLLVFPI